MLSGRDSCNNVDVVALEGFLGESDQAKVVYPAA
jgi:hypothetical protein